MAGKDEPVSQTGKDLIAAMNEALIFAGGEKAGTQVHVVQVPDVRAIRRQLHMSQQVFAATYQIPLPTLKNWEQRRRSPDAPAAAYLRAIARRPKDIEDALRQEA
jgi:putative transcriptional regulator